CARGNTCPCRVLETRVRALSGTDARVGSDAEGVGRASAPGEDERGRELSDSGRAGGVLFTRTRALSQRVVPAIHRWNGHTSGDIETVTALERRLRFVHRRPVLV